MKTAAQIIETLGGSSKVAASLGLPITTVHSWTRVNAIPRWRHPALIDLAKGQSSPLEVDDFPDRSSRVKPAAQPASAA